ncbi:hypothetical protein [Paraburkholderia phytofirmans]|uniref:hypothetical protein n=1 Tax=Paraburkholderia phytofirmans TaxID=261302 RepID=UPI0038B9379A
MWLSAVYRCLSQDGADLLDSTKPSSKNFRLIWRHFDRQRAQSVVAQPSEPMAPVCKAWYSILLQTYDRHVHENGSL